jgi:hypothetical protein
MGLKFNLFLTRVSVLAIVNMDYRFSVFSNKRLTLSLTGGGPIGPPLFKRPVAQKVIKLKKFGKKPEIWGPEYSCSEVRYLQKSSVESTLCHCRRCYGPPLPPTELGVGGGDCWGAKQNKNSRQKCHVFI